LRLARGKTLLVVALLAAQVIVFSQPAQAAGCDGKHILIRTKNAATHWGMRGRVSVPIHQVDTCSGAAAVATIHIERCSTICGTQVEMGMLQEPDGDLFIFTEQQNGPTVHYDYIALGAFSTLIGFRIKVTQVDDVLFEYDIGSGFQYSPNNYSISWAPGYDYGESEKIGAAPQMSSSHRNLKYLSANWTEVDWLGMKCSQDEAPGWSWSPIPNDTGNDYDVVNVAGSGQCAAV
jgi:hypothetical protein